MKKLCLLLLCCLTFSLNAQETATATTETSQEQLRCEVKEKYADGSPKQSFYYNTADELTKVINYYENGNEATIHYVKDNKKAKSITYNKSRGFLEIEEHFNGDYKSCKIVYEERYDNKHNKAIAVPFSANFYLRDNGEQKFKAYFQEGKLIQIELFNSKGIKVKALHYDFGTLTGESYWYYDKAHGWVYSIDKNGVKTPIGFMHKGVKTDGEKFPNWQKDIQEFDKIPELEKKVNILLKKYNLI